MAKDRMPLVEATTLDTGLRERLRAAVGMTDRLLNTTPVMWFYPPWSSFYPNPPAKGSQQSTLVIGVSTSAIHSLNIAGHNGQPLRVPRHVATPRPQIASVDIQIRLRRVRDGRRSYDQEVVVAKIIEGSGRVWIHAETPFRAGLQLQEALGRPVLSSTSAGGTAHQAEGLAEELKGLAALYQSGALTGSEWERAKAALVGKPVDRRVEALDALSYLHHLHESGAITDYEYSRKKLEILTW